MVRAGTMDEAVRESGEWAFVDVGFSSKSRSCGFQLGEGEATALTFARTREELVRLACTPGKPLNVVIEAPLSVAFSANGNPCGRSLETRNGKSRFWYVGLGCTVMVAASYLIADLAYAPGQRDNRLFEGFVSFKTKGAASDHRLDVRQLQRVIWGDEGIGDVLPPEALRARPPDQLLPAFRFAGVESGVPPVVRVL
jgi:hypothetical protein